MKINYNRVWYCTKCGEKIPYIIPRVRGKERCVSHLKKLWCLNCKEECNAAETEEGTQYDKECFYLEFNYNNFDEQGNRKEDFKQFKAKLRKEGVIK